MSQFRVTAISSGVVSREAFQAPAQDNTFLIGQTYVRDASGWYVASILPIANNSYSA
jgi:hypothetical protein